MANNITGVGTANTDADAFVPELWSAGVQNYIKKKFVLANLVNESALLAARKNKRVVSRFSRRSSKVTNGSSKI